MDESISESPVGGAGRAPSSVAVEEKGSDGRDEQMSRVGDECNREAENGSS